MRGLSSDEEDDGDPPKNLKCKETFREDGISLSSFLISSSYRSRLLEPYDVNEIPIVDDRYIRATRIRSRRFASATLKRPKIRASERMLPRERRREQLSPASLYLCKRNTLASTIISSFLARSALHVRR